MARWVKRWVGRGIPGAPEIADDRLGFGADGWFGAEHDRNNGGFALNRTVRLAGAPLGAQTRSAAAWAVAVSIHGT